MLEQKAKELLAEQFPDDRVSVHVDERNLVHMSGEATTWQSVVDIGHALAKLEGVRNVVSEVTVPGVEIPQKDYAAICEKGKKKGVIREADVVVIGAGITGCGIARELSKYNLKVIVTERGDDVAYGSSKSNNGCIHHGMDVKPGTLKSEMNRLGNARYSDWEEEIHVGLLRCGSIEVVTKYEDLPILYERLEKGLKNGTEGIGIINAEKCYEIEPALKREGIDVVAGLHMPSFGVVEPFYVCIALAENAVANGAEFLFEHTVGGLELEDASVRGVITDQGIIRTRYVVNAAGMFADDIAKMANDQLYTIHNRRGTIAIFDKSTPPTFTTEILIRSDLDNSGKDAESKGGGMHTTPEYNLLAGPSAFEKPDREDTQTSYEDLEYVERANMQDPHNPKANIIKIFGGARPSDFMEDFTIEMSEITDGFVHAACIQSPGVASAPAIADRVVDIILDDCKKKNRDTTVRPDYQPYRNKPVEFRKLSREEQDRLIEQDRHYGRIICRCEHVTEAEVLEALRSPLHPSSITAIKHRVRCGMGRCQGGFCQPRVLELIAKERNIAPEEVNLRASGSNILLQENRREGE